MYFAERLAEELKCHFCPGCESSLFDVAVEYPKNYVAVTGQLCSTDMAEFWGSDASSVHHVVFPTFYA